MSEAQQVWVDYLTGKTDAVKTAEKLDELIQRNTKAVINFDIKKASLENAKRELKNLRLEAEGKAIQYKADVSSAQSKIELLKNQLNGLEREKSILLNIDVSDLESKKALINSEIEKLESKRISFKADMDEIDAQIKLLKAQKAEIKADVKIDKKEAQSQIDDIERQIKNLEKTKAEIDVDSKEALRSITALTEEIKELDSEINKRREVALGSKEVDLVNQKIETTEKELESLKGYEIELKDNFTEESNRIKQIDVELDRVTEEEREINIDAKNAKQEISEATRNGNLLIETMNKASISGVEAANRIASAFTNVSNLFQSISRLNPFGRIFRLATGTLVSKATSALIGNVSGAIDRYDTLKTSALALNGVFGQQENATERISKAMTDLDESVQGLPTSLDDIVGSAKQFMTITNDIEKGTKIAIATNRAFLASGADAQQTYFGTKQLQDLLSAGKLRTQEWESLFKSMPLALREVAKVLKYDEDEFGQFRQDLKAGTVSAEEFFDALIKSGAESEGAIYQLAENSKQMIQSVITNWSIAIKRGYVKLFDAFDAISQEFTGKSLVSNLSEFKNNINDVFDDMAKYIKENKEYFYDLALTIKNFPFREILSGLGEYAKMWLSIAKSIGEATKAHPGMLKFLTVFLSISPMIAKGTGVIGTLIKSFTSLANLSKDIGKGGTIAKGGILARLLGSKKDLTDATKTAKEVSEGAGDIVASTGKTAMSLENVFSNLLQSLSGVIKVGSVIAVAEGSIWLGAKALKELQSIGELDWEQVAKNFVTMTSAVSAYVALMGFLGKMGAEGLKTELIGGAAIAIADFVMVLSSASFKKASKDTAEGIDNLISSIERLQTDIQFAKIKNNVKQLMEVISEIDDIVQGKGEDWQAQGEKVVPDWKMLGESTKNILIAVEPLIAVSKGLAKIQKNVKDVDIDNAMIELEDSIESIKSALVKIKEYKLEDYRGSIDAFENNLEYLADATEQIKTITSNFDTDTNWIKLRDKLIMAIDGIELVLNSLDMSPIQTIKGGYKDANLQPQVESFKKAVRELTDAVTSIVSIAESMKDIDTEQLLSLFGNGSVKGTFQQAIDGIKLAFDSIQGAFNFDTKTPEAPSLSGKPQIKPDITDSLGKEIEAFKGVMEKMSEIASYFKEVNDNMADIKWENIGNTLSTAISDIVNAISFKDQNIDFEALTSNADSLNAIMASIQLVSENIAKIEGALADTGDLDISSKLGDAIKGIKKALEEVETSGLEEKAQTLDNVANTIKRALKKIKNSASITAGDMGFGKLATAIQNCIDGLNTLNEIEVKEKTITVKDKFSDNISKFIKQMKKAREQENITRTITVNKITNNTTNNTTNNIATFNIPKSGKDGTRYPYTGGLITLHDIQYKALGGSIFKHKGTDTVPAMLTPGEYVVKRSAVKRFGVDFMQKINNLDINGALRDLSYRAGQKVSTITSSKTVKNITNNNRHNDVTINNNYHEVSSPEFRAGRFVRSLG